MFEIGDPSTIKRIDLYHPDMPVYVHIEPHLYDGAKIITDYITQTSFVASEWITVCLMVMVPVQYRTTWESSSRFVEGWQTSWDCQSDRMIPKLAAFEQAGYLLAKVWR